MKTRFLANLCFQCSKTANLVTLIWHLNYQCEEFFEKTLDSTFLFNSYYFHYKNEVLASDIFLSQYYMPTEC